MTECLRSISRQTFGSFEVIVGNDDTKSPLALGDLGIVDPRFRVVNHPENLGEMGNMNRLLQLAHGAYFTWLADDDTYTPGYLATMERAFRRFAQSPVVFCGYNQGTEFPSGNNQEAVHGTLYPGSDFLTRYLRGEIRTLGVCAAYRADHLRMMGGMRQLGTGFSPYSDNLLVMEAGLLPAVVFIDAPLVFFRIHAGSISFTSRSIDAYVSAQSDLASHCERIFKAAPLLETHDVNFALLLEWFVRDFGGVVVRARRVSVLDLVRFGKLWVRSAAHIGNSAQRWVVILFTIRRIFHVTGSLIMRLIGQPVAMHR